MLSSSSNRLLLQGTTNVPSAKLLLVIVLESVFNYNQKLPHEETTTTKQQVQPPHALAENTQTQFLSDEVLI